MISRMTGIAAAIGTLLAVLLAAGGRREALPVTATMSTGETTASGEPCRVLLVGKNSRRPLANRKGWVSLSLDGSRIDAMEIDSDANGIADAGELRARQSEILRKQGSRVSWHVGLAERQVEVDLSSCGAKPIPVAFDVGALTVTGRFVTRDGKPVRVPRDLFPAAVRDYVKPQHGWWASQLRVFAQEDNRLLVNQVGAKQDGTFILDLDAPGRVRFELVGEQDYRIVTPVIDVAKGTTSIAVVVEAKPYCVYGMFRDAATGEPLSDGISIDGPGIYFHEISTPRYALCFDSPGRQRLTASDSFRRRYLSRAIDIDVRQPVQRQDILLGPLARAKSAIRLRIELTGDRITQPVSLIVRGESFSTSEYGNGSSFDVVVPRPGRYTMQAWANGYAIPSVTDVLIERDQTVRLTAVEKRTHLAVRILGPDGAPIPFPPIRQLHEPPTNCVMLDEDATESSRRRRYAISATGNLGDAVRPDETGTARFRLVEGGRYHLTVDLERYERVVREIELTEGGTTRVDVTLKRKE